MTSVSSPATKQSEEVPGGSVCALSWYDDIPDYVLCASRGYAGELIGSIEDVKVMQLDSDMKP